MKFCFDPTSSSMFLKNYLRCTYASLFLKKFAAVKQPELRCFHLRALNGISRHYNRVSRSQADAHAIPQLRIINKPLILRHRLLSAMASSGNHAQHPENRLAKEKSPYLLQHKNNPVDWYPWGKEAFEKARRENKLIFLSVGYSTCHWCHVMERESFENEDIAKIMNDNFVCVKVDREERPDVDRIYMTFIQATQGGGGWPMSVFLTPDLKPITGGTYFPPTDQYGRPGFPTVLRRIADVWQKKRQDVEEQSSALMEALKAETGSGADPSAALPDQAVFKRCYEAYKKKYDSVNGGFERAPKFPSPVNLDFLFRVSCLPNSAKDMPAAREMCYKTLDSMADGGIHDHIGFGFHRYSTDEKWHVPHFEKMLYDNAQLLASYVEAFQISDNERYKETALRIIEYINRDMTDPSGGIYSAEDADSLPPSGGTHKKEGAFYVWTEKEIDDALAKTVEGRQDVRFSDVFKKRFDVHKKGNVHPAQDPHDELRYQNVLIIRSSLEELARQFKLTTAEIADILENCRRILFDIRVRRPRPHLDDKMIAAWNGLILTGFSKAVQAFQDEKILTKAIQIATFMRQHLYRSNENVLLHSVYKGQTGPSQTSHPIEGFCEDYACVIRGLLDLYEASFDPAYLKWAFELQTKQDELFWDKEDGGYFSSHSHDESILLRLKEEADGAEPSPNSVSLNNLLRLSLIFDKKDWNEKAIKMFRVFANRFESIPRAIPEMICGLMFHLSKPSQVVICGEATDANAKRLSTAVQKIFSPFKVALWVDKRAVSILSPLMDNPEAFAGMATSMDGSVHICRNFACGVPIRDPEELQKQLSASMA